MEHENNARVSYMLAEKSSKWRKSLTDGEIIKECIQCSIDVVCPTKSEYIKNISLYGLPEVYKI